MIPKLAECRLTLPVRPVKSLPYCPGQIATSRPSQWAFQSKGFCYLVQAILFPPCVPLCSHPIIKYGQVSRLCRDVHSGSLFWPPSVHHDGGSFVLSKPGGSCLITLNPWKLCDGSMWPVHQALGHLYHMPVSQVSIEYLCHHTCCGMSVPPSCLTDHWCVLHVSWMCLMSVTHLFFMDVVYVSGSWLCWRVLTSQHVTQCPKGMWEDSKVVFRYITNPSHTIPKYMCMTLDCAAVSLHTWYI